MALDNAITLQVNNKYFDRFQNKDLNYLARLYSNDIKLTDWNGEWTNPNDVLEVNEAFFENEFTLTLVSTTEFYAEGAANPIGYSNVITLEVGGETLNIVDELVFDDNYKIISIYATQQ